MTAAFRRVAQQVARNPVARAVAREAMVDTVRTFQIHAYIMREGEDATATVMAISQVLAVCLLAAGAQNATAGVSTMRWAMSALVQCSQRGFKWHTDDAVAVDGGLSCAVELYPKLSPDGVAWAWRQARIAETEGVAA